jgi:hypothetical protein
MLRILILFACVGCASYTKMPEKSRVALDLRYKNRKVELKSSCYYGDLYDENEKFLLSPYPFDDVFHLVDLDNAPIHPKGQRGIVPAGTPFVIDRIEFPDVAAMSRRMLTTPRYNPWVYLKIAPEAQGFPTERTYILVLPMDFTTEEAIENEIAVLLAPEGKVTKWLAEVRPTIRVAIEHKDVAEGMSKDELMAAWGRPRKWIPETEADVAWYPKNELWLVKDVVTAIKPPRSLESPPTPQDTAKSGG